MSIEGWTVSDQESRPVGRPLLFESVEQLQEKIDLYFEVDSLGMINLASPASPYSGRPSLACVPKNVSFPLACEPPPKIW